MKKIAVYGSLKKGFHNHRLIEASTFIKEAVVELPYKMISLGGFPGLIQDEVKEDKVSELEVLNCNLNPIHIEIYEVDDQTYKSVERLEGYPRFYDKHIFEFEGDQLEIYVLNENNKKYNNCKLIEGGNW